MNNLQTLSFDDSIRLLKTGELSFFNFYNADIPVTSYYSSKYYLEHEYDTMENAQKINTLFVDIEFYNGTGDDMENISDAPFPINAITICDSVEKVYTSFYLLYDFNYEAFGITNDPTFQLEQLIQTRQLEFKKTLVEHGYITEDYNLRIQIYTKEEDLLQAFCVALHRIDPDILSGWNTDFFDFPYIYYRMIKLFGKQNTDSMLSKLGRVTNKYDRISIPEFVIADLLYLYKPRDEGGLNLGKKRAMYTLDNISSIELGVKKIEYKETNVDLMEMYRKDPIMFLLYNIVDVALTWGIDKKLKHVDLYNSIRRIMRTPFSASIAGSSVLFDTYVYSNLQSKGQHIRYGINNESNRNLDPEEMANFPQVKDPKGVPQKPPKIPSRTYSKMITRYPGAFVKDPTPKIINDGSLVIDLDAAKLYPSMILQSNISFDSYRARIIPTVTYKLLSLLEVCLGKQQYPDSVFNNIEVLVWKYVNNAKPKVDKKKDTAIQTYYVIIKLLDDLMKSGYRLEHILQPTETKASIYLRNVLIPLLDLMNLCHPENPGHSQFAYDYLFMERTAENDPLISKYPEVYIIHNPGDSNTWIQKYSIKDAENIIKQFTFTLAGTMFDRHATNLGLFTNFLILMSNFRTKYKDARQACARGTDEWDLNNNRQASIKVVMNTTYGLYGLSSFRYSNHWLAQSITNNGLLTIKLAQYLGEQYLQYNYGD